MDHALAELIDPRFATPAPGQPSTARVALPTLNERHRRILAFVYMNESRFQHGFVPYPIIIDHLRQTFLHECWSDTADLIDTFHLLVPPEGQPTAERFALSRAARENIDHILETVRADIAQRKSNAPQTPNPTTPPTSPAPPVLGNGPIQPPPTSAKNQPGKSNAPQQAKNQPAREGHED